LHEVRENIAVLRSILGDGRIYTHGSECSCWICEDESGIIRIGASA
jgi:hypothetical protein